MKSGTFYPGSLVLAALLLGPTSLAAELHRPELVRQEALYHHSFRYAPPHPRGTPAWNPLRLARFDSLPAQRGLTALHYASSNENRIDLFREHVAGRGGGYVGVGTDQNLTLIAWARSEYAYLMDFDPVVVGVNRIHLFFLEIAPDPATYKDLWMKKRPQSTRLIQERFRGDPEYKTIMKAWDVATADWKPVPFRFRRLAKLEREFGLRHYLNDQRDFLYLKNLVAAGRILAVPGDLRGDTTLRGISQVARKLDVPVRVFYVSNAEDYFNEFGRPYRSNILDLPVDRHSVLVRTCSIKGKTLGYPPGELFAKKPFHYNVQPLVNMQEWMYRGIDGGIYALLQHRRMLGAGISVVTRRPPAASRPGALNENQHIKKYLAERYFEEGGPAALRTAAAGN